MEKEHRLILEALEVLLRKFAPIDIHNNIKEHLESERIIEKYHEVNKQGKKELNQQAEKALEKKGQTIERHKHEGIRDMDNQLKLHPVSQHHNNEDTRDHHNIARAEETTP